MILFIWTVLYFLSFTLLGVSRYPWYYAPLVPAFIVLVGLGIVGFHRFLTRFSSMNSQRLPALASGLLLIVLGVGQFLYLFQVKSIPDSRRLIYRSVGEWLANNTSASDLVGTLEVGIMGYYSSRPMLDFAGLVQPEVGSRLGPATSYADSAQWAIATYRPRYVVLMSGLFPELESGYISQHCHVVKTFAGQDYRFSGDIDVYQCAFSPV